MNAKIDARKRRPGAEHEKNICANANARTKLRTRRRLVKTSRVGKPGMTHTSYR